MFLVFQWISDILSVDFSLFSFSMSSQHARYYLDGVPSSLIVCFSFRFTKNLSSLAQHSVDHTKQKWRFFRRFVFTILLLFCSFKYVEMENVFERWKCPFISANVSSREFFYFISKIFYFVWHKLRCESARASAIKSSCAFHCCFLIWSFFFSLKYSVWSKTQTHKRALAPHKLIYWIFEHFLHKLKRFYI